MNATKWIWCGLIAVCLVLSAATVLRSRAAGETVSEKVVLAPYKAPALKPPAPILVSQEAAPARGNPIHVVEAAVQKAREAGAGENEVYRLRAAHLSTQTIALLSEREAAEKEWLRRLTAWRAERARLNQADPVALQALRDRLFSADEQTRLEANEAIDSPKLILR